MEISYSFSGELEIDDSDPDLPTWERPHTIVVTGQWPFRRRVSVPAERVRAHYLADDRPTTEQFIGDELKRVWDGSLVGKLANWTMSLRND